MIDICYSRRRSKVGELYARKELTMSPNDMLGSALAEVAGPLKDFSEKLRGAEGPLWFAAFKKFLRKENCWPEGTFSHDMRKEGWTLLENTSRRLNSVSGLDLISFLRDGESSANGEEVTHRARIELDANYGQEDAEFLLEHQEEIPEEFRQFYLVFPATVWRSSHGRHNVSYLYWHRNWWHLGFGWLGSDWLSHARFVRPRK